MTFHYRTFFTRLRDKVWDDDILGNAAQVAFYFSFALFPLLLFLMSLLGIILNDKQDLQNQLFLLLSQVMPQSGLKLAGAYDFERYDARFLGPTNADSVMEIYLPVLT